jgi:hypothetical protein
MPDLIRDHDIGAFGKVGLQRAVAEDDEAIRIPIGGRQRLGDLSHLAVIDRIDTVRTRPAREQSQNAGAGPQIDNHVSTPDHRGNRPGEGIHARAVGEVLPMFVELERHSEAPHLAFWVSHFGLRGPPALGELGHVTVLFELRRRVAFARPGLGRRGLRPVRFRHVAPPEPG